MKRCPTSVYGCVAVSAATCSSRQEGEAPPTREMTPLGGPATRSRCRHSVRFWPPALRGPPRGRFLRLDRLGSLLRRSPRAPLGRLPMRARHFSPTRRARRMQSPSPLRREPATQAHSLRRSRRPAGMFRLLRKRSRPPCLLRGLVRPAGQARTVRTMHLQHPQRPLCRRRGLPCSGRARGLRPTGACPRLPRGHRTIHGRLRCHLLPRLGGQPGPHHPMRRNQPTRLGRRSTHTARPPLAAGPWSK